MMPPTLVLLGAVVIALTISGIMRSCANAPEVDHGVELLKGGIAR